MGRNLENLEDTHRSETTLNYWMMVKRYPNLKKEVGGSISKCEISVLLEKNTCYVVNSLMCFGASVSAFCLKKKKKKKKKKKRRN